jgi:hypothetical protein
LPPDEDETKPYDRDSRERAVSKGAIEWRFKEFRLNAETAGAAQGCEGSLHLRQRSRRPAGA